MPSALSNFSSAPHLLLSGMPVPAKLRDSNSSMRSMDDQQGGCAQHSCGFTMIS
jgi:hypothetical protein